MKHGAMGGLQSLVSPGKGGLDFWLVIEMDVGCEGWAMFALHVFCKRLPSWQAFK